ncbi:MAG: S1C family serine protease [Acidobacteriota bacterium]
MEQNKQSLSARQPRKHPVVVVIVAIILALGVGGVAYWYSITNHAPTTSRQTTQNDGNLTPTGTENAITKVVDKVAPSVVSIVTNTTRQTLFGASQGQAAGTGIILSKDGYILTNNHVVASATKIEVVATDGTTYDEVEVVGADPLNDISYLKIKNAKDLQPAELGDSSTLRIGQQVVAIGNALGQYQNTVSSGIISGKGRPITAGGEGGDSGESLTDLLQTDAAINPGNSGGPLLNYSGQVIGINTAVASNAEGIGFAIPVNATKGTLKGVLAGKGVQRSYLGLRYVEITAAVAKQYDLPVKKGAYVAADKGGSAVIADSPAGKAGLQEKDIITKINDEEVGVSGGVSTLVGEYAPGDTIEVTYLRGGAEKRVKVTLATYLVD